MFNVPTKANLEVQAPARPAAWPAWSRSRRRSTTKPDSAANSGSTSTAYTTPTDPDTVVLEWTDEALMSPMRGGHQLPQDALAVGAQVRELTEGNRLEIMELMTPDKMLDVLGTVQHPDLSPVGED